MSAALLRLTPALAGIAAAAFPAVAETLVATRTIPVQTVLTAADVSLVDGAAAGAYSRPEQVIGLETRVTLYAGRPLRQGDIGPPAAVDRNEAVTLRFRAGALVIETDGRALDRAAIGDTARVMNLASRSVVIGRVAGPGLVEVGR